MVDRDVNMLMVGARGVREMVGESLKAFLEEAFMGIGERAGVRR